MFTEANTAEAADFMATAASRETSPQIMRAIVAFSRNLADAEYIWENGLGNFDGESAQAFINTATEDGRIDAADLFWGVAGRDWLPE